MSPAPTPPKVTKRPLVAVIDDEPEVAKSLRRLLRAVGFDVVIFLSGPEFLQSAQDRSPDCLILDLHMPGMTGLDVQRHLTATGMNVPVIVITGRDEPGLAVRILAAGARFFLLKPVNESELIGALSKLNLKPPEFDSAE
jgi:FixJ family two-component response regulator